MGSDKVKGAFAHNQRNRPPPKKGAAGNHGSIDRPVLSQAAVSTSSVMEGSKRPFPAVAISLKKPRLLIIDMRLFFGLLSSKHFDIPDDKPSIVHRKHGVDSMILEE
ncbi:hypothetical protein I7I51_05826 [Histoplasma capsulatum]|uniref:Uncharacterized protein n=1 Tax=Ajellomyces capsulatus TaxID=5037 RepID=A0A8A1M4Q8_AJECA|nr:hypothetical protein I7I51_05826 [Histoplasma capsulatum]